MTSLLSALKLLRMARPPRAAIARLLRQAAAEIEQGRALPVVALAPRGAVFLVSASTETDRQGS